MEKSKINFLKFNEELKIRHESDNLEKVAFEKFLYNLFSINNIIDTNEILDLNIQYINRTVRILNKIDFYDENNDLLNENDYISIMELYRFYTVLQNFNNYRCNSNNNIIPKSLMFI